MGVKKERGWAKKKNKERMTKGCGNIVEGRKEDCVLMKGQENKKSPLSSMTFKQKLSCPTFRKTILCNGKLNVKLKSIEHYSQFEGVQPWSHP